MWSLPSIWHVHMPLFVNQNTPKTEKTTKAKYKMRASSPDSTNLANLCRLITFNYQTLFNFDYVLVGTNRSKSTWEQFL